jgi:hypothetical protein
MNYLSRRHKRHSNLWPIYLKDQANDFSSSVLDLILLDRLLGAKDEFQIKSVTNISDYTYCPTSKIYLNHRSFNTGDETHFLYHQDEVAGSLVIRVPTERISNWRSVLIYSKVVEYLRFALRPLEINTNVNPYIFNDHHSLKIGFSVVMEVENEHFSHVSVNVFFDLSQESGKLLIKSLK